jgi:Glycosyltransferase family 87
MRGAAAAALVGLTLLVPVAALPNVGFLDRANKGDTPEYGAYGHEILHGKIPYRDFYDEYPPGAIPVFVVPAALPGVASTMWSKLVQLLLAGVCVVCVAVTCRGRWRFVAAALVGLSPALLGKYAFTRYDFWPAALTSASLAALLARRNRLSLALLALAVAAKVYPAVLLPLFLLFVGRSFGRREATRAATVFVAVIAIVVLPFAALGPGGVRFSLYGEFRRPLQVEALGASVLFVVHRLGGYAPHVVSSYGSQNLTGPGASAFAAASVVCEAIAILWVWASFARGARDDVALVVASVAVLLAVVAFGRVISPQYMIWLVPLVPLVERRVRGRMLALAGAAFLLTQTWSQSRYHDVVAGTSIVWAVLARDLVLVSAYALAAAALVRRTLPPTNASPAAHNTNSSGRLA